MASRALVAARIQTAVETLISGHSRLSSNLCIDPPSDIPPGVREKEHRLMVTLESMAEFIGRVNPAVEIVMDAATKPAKKKGKDEQPKGMDQTAPPG